MPRPLLKTTMVLVLAATLVGCKAKLTYTYLMEHPAVLKKEVVKCQSVTASLNADTSQCRVVMRAAVAFTALANEQQEDPEKFGQRMLDLEFSYVQAKTALKVAQQKVATLKSQQASQTDLQKAETHLAEARSQYQTKYHELQQLFAVLSLSSPE